jgi:hypothetical protein
MTRTRDKKTATRRGFIKEMAVGVSVAAAASSVAPLGVSSASTTQTKGSVAKNTANEAAILNDLKSLKADLQVIKDKNEIRNLLSRYAFRFDLGRYEQWYELWDEDAVFNSGTSEKPLRFKGKAAIRAYYGDVQKEYGASQHMQLNALIKVDGDNATALNYQVIFESKDSVDRIGNRGVRRWTFVKKNGRWLIKEADSVYMANKDACLKLMPGDW